MNRYNLFKENEIRVIEKYLEITNQEPYFDRLYRSFEWGILERHDAKEAEQIVKSGMVYAELIGIDKNLLPLAFVYKILPQLKETPVFRKLDPEQFPEALQDIRIWMDVFSKYHGGGIGIEEMEWVFKTLTGEVIRLGSLQYETVVYRFPFLIFGHRYSEEYRALAQPGLMVDQDGYLAGTNGRECMKMAKTTMVSRSNYVEGYEADLSQGIVCMKERNRLSRDEWQPVLIPGEAITALHIPEGADLDPDKIDSSLRAAREYYRDCRAGETFRLICDSWLLDPHLQMLLPDNSKILQFMRRFLKLPIYEEQPQILKRVMGFDFDRNQLLDHPCRTSLQNRLKRYLLDGGEVFTTAGFLFAKIDFTPKKNVSRF